MPPALRALFPRGSRLLLANGYVATVPMGFLMVVVPLYLARAGIEPAFIGLLYTVSGLVTSALVAASGILADRFGRRRFLLAGTLLPIASYAIFAATTDHAWLVVAAALGGVGLANGAAGAMTVASYDALLAERTSGADRTRVFTTAQALWNLALATGAAAAGVPELLRSLGMGEIDSFRPAFLAAIALFIVRSFLTNLSWPFQQSLLMGAVIASERASAAGIGFAVWGLANAVGPGIAGILLGTGFLALPLLAGGAAYGLAGLVFGIGFARIHARLRPPAHAGTPAD